MASYKQTQNALKAPDEFQKLGQEALPFLEKYGKQVVLAVGGLLAVGFVVALTATLRARSHEEAARSFGAALRVLERDVSDDESPVVRPGEQPPFKTEAEKDAAIIKSLTDFRAAHKATPAAVSAALPLAQALLREGKASEAMPLVDEYLGQGDESDPMRPAGYEARGYALEAQGKLDEALASFDDLARNTKTDFYKGMGLYHRGRILALKGDKDAAAKVFSEIEGAAPGTAAARMAKDRLSALAAQGVALPAPAALPTTPAPTP